MRDLLAEVEQLTEAPAAAHGVDRGAVDRNVDLALHEEIETLTRVTLADDRRLPGDRPPRADPQCFPERDVVEVLEGRERAQLVELRRVGDRLAGEAQRRKRLREILAEVDPGLVAVRGILPHRLETDLVQ